MSIFLDIAENFYFFQTGIISKRPRTDLRHAVVLRQNAARTSDRKLFRRRFNDTISVGMIGRISRLDDNLSQRVAARKRIVVDRNRRGGNLNRRQRRTIVKRMRA